jgi:hypothetical protein
MALMLGLMLVLGKALFERPMQALLMASASWAIQPMPASLG